MARKKANAELTNAERVRNNQRRSRARRKEYIAELEAKIRQYESGHDQDLTSSRIEGLAKELETLKKLLHALGLDDAFVEAHGKAVQLASTWAQDERTSEETIHTSFSLPQSKSQFIPGLQAHLDPLLQSPTGSSLGGHQTTIQRPLEDLNALDATLRYDFSAAPTDPASTADSLGSPDLFGQSQDLALNLSTTPPQGLESSMTTLCTVAFSLVLKSNRKGVSAADLDRKLRVGYRFSAAPLEGCRVDNHVLLDVLADIL